MKHYKFQPIVAVEMALLYCHFKLRLYDIDDRSFDSNTSTSLWLLVVVHIGFCNGSQGGHEGHGLLTAPL